MTGEFSRYGAQLLANGYLILPIKPGHKRPALDAWQNARFSASDLHRYNGSGVGLLTGQGAVPICAIDIDTMHEGLAVAMVDWCREHLGCTLERVGMAPKILLVYRAAEEGYTKATGAWFEDLGGQRHRVEVLGKGQQFVAHHIHPDTGKPYEWVDLVGGVTEMAAQDLPIVDAAGISAALAAFERLAVEHGLTRVAGSVARTAAAEPAAGYDPLMEDQPAGIKLSEAKRLLGFIDPADYDTWLRAGMSLHHEYEGSEAALGVWDEWSSAARNYAGRSDLEMRWASFGKGGSKATTIRWLLKFGREAERSAQRVEKLHSRDEMLAIINAVGDEMQLLGQVAREAAAASENDLTLRVLFENAIQGKFKELSGAGVKIADVRIAMSAGRKPLNSGKRFHERTEMGNAERMLDQHGSGLMYVSETDNWYRWTGACWVVTGKAEIEELCKRTTRVMVDEVKQIDSDEERAAFLKFCTASQRIQMVEAMVKLSRSDPRVLVPFSALNRHSHLFGVANGVVDLRTGQLRDADPQDRITVVASVDYDPKARAPLWERTVADVFFGDTDMVAFFQRLIGYSLMGRPNEDIIVIPYGTGSNGKSTVLGCIREVLGGHANQANAETFLSKGEGGGANAGGAREDVLRLQGSRFVYVGEPENGAELREGLVKSITGGDPIPARGLYAKRSVEVVPTWVTFMPTNHKPIIKNDDVAIWRRIMLVPFTRNFELEQAKDTDRADKLRDEYQGILRWCVEGALAYQRDGLRPPDKVETARREYREQMDLLADWLDECCDVGESYEDSTRELWASWAEFARARGELRFITNSMALGRRLGSRFPARRIKRERGFGGLRVKPLSL